MTNKTYSFFSITYFCCILFIFSFTNLYCSPSRSQQLYSVSNIEATASAGSAAIAKDIAIKKAKRLAFKRLIKRISINNTENNITIDNITSKLSDREIDDYVLDIGISDEKFGSKKYRANFKINFDSSKIQHILKAHNITVTSFGLSSLLVIPILQIEDRAYLWEEENIWKQYWDNNQTKMDSPMAPIVLAYGDINDITVINYEKLLNGNKAALSLMMQKYSVEGILISHLRKVGGSKSLHLSYFDGINIYPIYSDYIDETLPDAEFFKIAAINSIISFEEFLKNTENFSSNEINNIQVQIDVDSAEKVIKFRNILEKISRETSLSSFSKDSVIFSCKIKGSIDNFINELRGLNINITQSDYDKTKLVIIN